MPAEYPKTIHVGGGPDFKRVADPLINNAGSRLITSKLNLKGAEYLNTRYSSFHIARLSNFGGVDFIPEKQQIEAAPESVKTLFELLGITSTDHIAAQLMLDPMSGNFEISYIPKTVTDSCLGAIISSDPKYSGVIALAYTGPVIGDVQVPHSMLFKRDDHTGYPTIEHEPENVIRQFNKLNAVSEREFDGRRFSNQDFIRHTPEMARLLSDSVDYILELNEDVKLQAV